MSAFSKNTLCYTLWVWPFLHQRQVTTWPDGKDELRDDGEANDPDGDEQLPELVVEGSRILEVEDEDVPRHDDPVHEEKHLSDRGVLEEVLN